MKYLKLFESFEVNEGILDYIKSKSKGIFKGGRRTINVDSHPHPKNRRLPQKVSRIEVEKKLDFNKIPFTKNELNFIDELKKKYKLTITKYFYELDRPDNFDEVSENDDSHTISIENESIWIQIIKLDDDWYLIVQISKDVYGDEDLDVEDPSSEYFICDEWEEVVGYLENYFYKKI